MVVSCLFLVSVLTVGDSGYYMSISEINSLHKCLDK